MNKEIQSIIDNLQNVLSGEPWYGRPVYQILEEINISKASAKPNNSGHSALELLYHMLTWADFTLKRIEGSKEDMAEFEKLDWRTIDPAEHTWQKGLASVFSLSVLSLSVFSLSIGSRGRLKDCGLTD